MHTVTIPARYFRDMHAEYVKTPEWEALRAAVFARDGGKCTQCGADAAVVHHLTYERWRSEMLYDLTSLCLGCHDRAHGRGAYAEEHAAPRSAYGAIAGAQTPAERLRAMASRVMRAIIEQRRASATLIDVMVEGDFALRRAALEWLTNNRYVDKYADSGLYAPRVVLPEPGEPFAPDDVAFGEFLWPPHKRPSNRRNV